MDKSLLSVGLDVGTTTTQMIVSRLTVRNRASGFAVPQMEITHRAILYESPVHFTPLVGEKLVDGEKIRALVEEEYKNAGIKPEQVDTGAVIITGETSRKENARTVLDTLSDFAGDFVVTTAGPHLESVLAAKGAGAMERSLKERIPVLHIDIGGGTSNLCLMEQGNILSTGCLNVGGRLIKRDKEGKITYVSPVLEGFTDLKVGDMPAKEELLGLAKLLCDVLCEATGRKEKTHLLDAFSTKEAGSPWQPPETPVLVSFSGGVAECIEREVEENAYGDLGPLLGKAIGGSSLCRGPFHISGKAIRSTVIGAGCHATMLSGSTVFTQNVPLPLKNLPVAVFTEEEQEDLLEKIPQKGQAFEAAPVLALPGYESPSYGKIRQLADTLARACPQGVFVCLQQDMAMALGNALSLLLPPKTPILCLDGLAPTGQCYLDVGSAVGPCIPVVIKTLVFERGNL